MVGFYESDHAFKTIWRLSCLCHLIKIKEYFFKSGRPVFIVATNTSCSGICYAIYARQNFFYNALAPNGGRALFKFLTGINSVTNALTLGIYSYSSAGNCPQFTRLINHPFCPTYNQSESAFCSIVGHFPSFLSVALTLAMSQVYDYSFLLLFGAPRVCLWIEIRRYKNTIRIRIIA